MPRSIEIQEQMRNKIVDIYQSGKGYKAISKALGLQQTWNSSETSQEWADQNDSKSATTTHQGGHRGPTFRTKFKELHASFASIKVTFPDSTIRKRQKRHP